MPSADLADVRLYYERAGTGAPELLFVSGWCCDHTAFQPQFDHFARTNAVTSYDPRGIGQSGQPDSGYSIPDLADDLAALCAELGIESPVVVGHSLGGMIAVELGARYPSLPGALVLVDPGPIAPCPRRRSSSAPLPTGSRGRTARSSGASTSRTWAHATRRPPAGSSTSCARLSSRSPLPSFAASASGTAARLFEIKPDLEIGISVGAGHFQQIEVPEQVNAMPERFLALSL